MDNFVDPFADENFQYNPNAEYSLGLNSNSSFTITKLVNIGENSFYIYWNSSESKSRNSLSKSTKFFKK